MDKFDWELSLVITRIGSVTFGALSIGWFLSGLSLLDNHYYYLWIEANMVFTIIGASMLVLSCYFQYKLNQSVRCSELNSN